MNQAIKILSGVLIAQVLLFVLLTFNGSNKVEFAQTKDLLTVDFDKLSKWVIEDGEKNKLVIVKEGGKWILPDYHQFPVSESKFTELQTKLKEFKTSWPVGRTMISAKQFKVTDEKFERKLIFQNGDQVVSTLYLGSSPSFKKIHARVDGAEETYSLDFNAYDIPTGATNWVDKKYYEIDRVNIKTVGIHGVELLNEGGQFKLTQLPEDKQTNSSKVASIISTVMNPDFEDVMGVESAINTDHKEELTYTITTQADEKIVYSFREIPDGAKKADDKKAAEAPKESEFLSLKVSKFPYVFKVRRSQVKDLISLNRDRLMEDKPAEKSDTTGSVEGEGADNHESSADGNKSESASTAINEDDSSFAQKSN